MSSRPVCWWLSGAGLGHVALPWNKYPKKFEVIRAQAPCRGWSWWLGCPREGSPVVGPSAPALRCSQQERNEVFSCVEVKVVAWEGAIS